MWGVQLPRVFLYFHPNGFWQRENLVFGGSVGGLIINLHALLEFDKAQVAVMQPTNRCPISQLRNVEMSKLHGNIIYTNGANYRALYAITAWIVARVGHCISRCVRREVMQNYTVSDNAFNRVMRAPRHKPFDSLVTFWLAWFIRIGRVGY